MSSFIPKRIKPAESFGLVSFIWILSMCRLRLLVYTCVSCDLLIETCCPLNPYDQPMWMMRITVGCDSELSAYHIASWLQPYFNQHEHLMGWTILIDIIPKKHLYFWMKQNITKSCSVFNPSMCLARNPLRQPYVLFIVRPPAHAF